MSMSYAMSRKNANVGNGRAEQPGLSGEQKTWRSLFKLHSVEPLALPWLLFCKDGKQAKDRFL